MTKMLAKIKKKISKIFEMNCPDCGGIVEYEFYDPIRKKNVYKC